MTDPHVDLSYLDFHTAMGRVSEHVRAQQAGRPFESFQSGWMHDQEGYKSALRDLALRRLDADAWDQRRIGNGDILRATIAAVEIDDPETGLFNNLVQWQEGKWGAEECSHAFVKEVLNDPRQRGALETLIYDF